MKFASPLWLWGLLALPLIFGIVQYEERLRRRRFTRFVSESLWAQIVPEWRAGLRTRKTVLGFVALACVFVSLARPQWGTKEETLQVTGLDVVFVLDVSNSMEVEDVVPSRIKAAKHAIKTVIDRMQGGDRVGLVAFAGSSYLACPLTADQNYFLDTVQILSPKMVANQGTDIGIGLETAWKALERSAEESNTPVPSDKSQTSASRVIIMLSDGEDHEAGALAFAKKIRDSSTRLYILGVGSQKGGPIPVRDESGTLRGYKKDASGQSVVSAFKPDALAAIAAAAGGKYSSLTPGEAEIDEILRDLGALNRKDYAERKYVVYQDRFQYPLAIAVFFLFLEISAPLRKRLVTRKRVENVLIVLLLLGGGASSSAWADASLPVYLENKRGLEAFQEGKMDEAKQRFGAAQAQDPALPELDFNSGVIQLNEGNADGAAQAFQNSAQKGNEELKAKSLYNLGLALSKKGDVPSAVQSYAGAIQSAQQAKNPQVEADARKNIELLIKQEQQKKQQQKDQQKDKQKDSQKEQQKEQEKQKEKQQQQKPGKYQETSAEAKKDQFKSKHLSKEDAERVMAELSNREKDLQAKLKKQKGKQQSNPKDW
ncbi:VWA domain-containing protein [Bdellovibrionota bacterium FG-2]